MIDSEVGGVREQRLLTNRLGTVITAGVFRNGPPWSQSIGGSAG